MANFIVPGEFGLNPWQRGTSFTSVADSTYTADRFVYRKSGTMVHDITKSSNVPVRTLPLTNWYPIPISSLQLDCTTADAAIAAGDFAYESYKIEGYDYQHLSQLSFKVKFWVYATLTGTYCIAFRNSGQDRSYVVEYTVSASNTWEQKVITVTPTPTAGTWDYTNGTGIEVSWTLAAGSTFQTGTTDSWVTGNFLATANQVNACNSTLNNFLLSGVVLGLSLSAAPNELPDDAWIHRESILDFCQRYYEKSYNESVDPGTITTVGQSSVRMSATNVNVAGIDRRFSSQKRTAPTMQWYSPVTGTVDRIDEGGVGDKTILSTTGAGERITGYPVASATLADGNVATAHWTADAEL